MTGDSPLEPWAAPLDVELLVDVGGGVWLHSGERGQWREVGRLRLPWNCEVRRVDPDLGVDYMDAPQQGLPMYTVKVVSLPAKQTP